MTILRAYMKNVRLFVEIKINYFGLRGFYEGI